MHCQSKWITQPFLQPPCIQSKNIVLIILSPFPAVRWGRDKVRLKKRKPVAAEPQLSLTEDRFPWITWLHPDHIQHWNKRAKYLLLHHRFWRGMYNRFENGIHPREPLGDLLAATTEHTQSLTDQADYLTKVLWVYGREGDGIKEYLRDGNGHLLAAITVTQSFLDQADHLTMVL